MLVVGALAGAGAAWLATSSDRRGDNDEAAEAATTTPDERGDDLETPSDRRQPRRTRQHTVSESSSSSSSGSVDAELTTADGQSLRVHVVGQRRLTTVVTIEDTSEMWVSEHAPRVQVRSPVWAPEGMEAAYALLDGGSSTSLVRWTPDGYARIPGTKGASWPTWTSQGLAFAQDKRIKLQREGGPEVLVAPASPAAEQLQPAGLGDRIWFVEDGQIVEVDLLTNERVLHGEGSEPAPGPELAWIRDGQVFTAEGARSVKAPLVQFLVWLESGGLSWQQMGEDWKTDLVVDDVVIQEEIAPVNRHSQAKDWLAVVSKAQDSLLFIRDDELVELRLTATSKAHDPALRHADGRMQVAYGDGNKLVVLDVTEVLD